MRLGLVTSNFGPNLTIPWEAILEAERLGFDAVWTAEAYGNDAVVPLAFIGARTTLGSSSTSMMRKRRPVACTGSEGCARGRIDTTRAIGSETRNVEPRPSVLSTVMSPPTAATML